MALSNELSSEIAAALLLEKKSPQELRELKDVLLEVHSTLQRMSQDARANRFNNRMMSPKTDRGGYWTDNNL